MDYLLSLSRNVTARSLVKSLGLPVNLPPVLKRAKTPRGLRLLEDVEVVVGCSNITDVTRELSKHLAPMGARVVWTGSPDDAAIFDAAAEAWAEPVRLAARSANDAPISSGRAGSSAPRASDTAPNRGAPATAAAPGPSEVNGASKVNGAEVPREARVYGIVYDATGLRSRADVDELYEFFSKYVKQLAPNGRVVVLAQPLDAAEQVVGGEQAAEVAARWQGLEGFVRSLGKELGRKGSTANLLWVAPGAAERVVGPLRFFLSRHSAFITCQPLRVDTSVAPSSYAFEGPLLGKVALVTGAARGIGKATAQALAAEGARLAIVEHPSAANDAAIVARELGASLFSIDLADPESAEKISQWVGTEFGAVDIVVHNAGLTRDKTLARMSRDAWDVVIDVNLDAIVRSSQALLSNGRIRDNGRIIVLSSVGGIAGNVGQTNYALTKAGLIGWTRIMSRQLASRGITVNAVAPGFIETQMTAKMPAVIREMARRLSAVNQGGLPEDVARAVTFFALPETFGVTGSVLRVCGGALIGA